MGPENQYQHFFVVEKSVTLTHRNLGEGSLIIAIVGNSHTSLKFILPLKQIKETKMTSGVHKFFQQFYDKMLFFTNSLSYRKINCHLPPSMDTLCIYSLFKEAYFKRNMEQMT